MDAMSTTAHDRGYKGLPLEGPIARWYARITRKDMKEIQALAERLTVGIGPEAAVLEVAPGPGYLAIELARLGSYRITGLDISRSFVRMAGENAQRADVRVDFRHGNAAAMPFDPESFDRVFCRAAFKNFSEPLEALDEMHRVLKPGGEALIIDMRGDVSSPEIDACVQAMGLSRFDAFLTKWIFRHVLLRRAYTADGIRALAARSRFGSCEIRQEGIGMEVRLRK